MISPAHKIRPESAEDHIAVETLVRKVFGPGVTTRAAHALREEVPHLLPLARVAIVGGTIAGTVRFTPVLWNGKEILMLGPLAVARHHAKQGIGRALMRAGMEAAQQACDEGGHDVVMLVGDLDYYAPFGFARIPAGSIRLLRPADPMRILGCALKQGALADLSGDVVRAMGQPETV